MKKILSGILALMLAGALTMPAFAAEGDITATDVTTAIGTEPEATVTPASLKADAADEEGMLRISSSTLLKIKLKLESDNAAGKKMSFIATQKLADDEAISKDKIQFIDEKTITSDGTVTIQFRPRLNQPVGIYNMRANTKGATMFSKFYKTVTDQIQPTLTNASDTPKKQDITVNINGYTEAWKEANMLYRVENNELKPVDYTIIEPTESTPNIATLKIKTTSDWATQDTHTFRFVPKDDVADNIAYNPITFTAKITEPEKVTSSITSEFISEGTIPEGLGGTITVPDTATEGNTVDVTAAAPKGYDIASVTYTPEGGESRTITEAEGKYSFTMPDKAVKVTVNITPKTYTLKLDLQGGSGINNTTIECSVENLPQLPSENPTLQDYNFTNWRTEPNGGGNVVTNEHFNTADKMLAFFGDSTEKTIYARWTERGKFTVAYIAPEAGVTNKPSDSNEYDQETTTQIVIPEQEPARAGYIFEGWKVDGDDTIYKYGSDNAVYTNIASIQGSLRFNAQWKLVTYTITLQDGEESSEISGNIVDGLPILTTPEKEGYDFKGWYTAETEGDKIETITAENVTGLNGTTLYARWEEIQTDDYEIKDVDQGNSKVKVIKRTDNGAYIIVATYTANGNLVKASIKDISNIQTTAAGEDVDVAGAFEGEYETVKVFMWNSLSDMQPRCPAFPVNK